MFLSTCRPELHLCGRVVEDEQLLRSHELRFTLCFHFWWILKTRWQLLATRWESCCQVLFFSELLTHLWEFNGFIPKEKETEAVTCSLLKPHFSPMQLKMEATDTQLINLIQQY